MALGPGANRVGRVFKWVELCFFSFLPFPSLPEQFSPHAFKRGWSKVRGEAAWSEKSESERSEKGVPEEAPAFVQSDAKQVQSVGLSSVGRVSRQGKDLAGDVRAQTEGGHR